MTDKEVKRLTRSQLIEIIYQLQLRQDELTLENEKLSKALEDKRIMLEDAGNVAQAVMEIHKVMQAAQDAAVHYLEEMQARAEEEYGRLIAKAKEEAATIATSVKQEPSQPAEQTRSMGDNE